MPVSTIKTVRLPNALMDTVQTLQIECAWVVVTSSDIDGDLLRCWRRALFMVNPWRQMDLHGGLPTTW